MRAALLARAARASLFALAGLAGLAGLAAVATAASAADVPARYTIAAKPLAGVPAGATWTFDLYADAACTELVHTAGVQVEDVEMLARLYRIAAGGAPRPARTVEIRHTLTGVPAGGPLYLVVTGAGVTPIPANGCQAQASAGGAASFERAVFQFQVIPPFGQPAALLASLTFVPPFSGNALLRARGYCNLTETPSVANGLNLALGTSPASAFAGAEIAGWGIVRVPASAVGAVHQAGWSAERVVGVVAGEPSTWSLYGRHEVGSGSADCTGTVVAELVAEGAS